MHHHEHRIRISYSFNYTYISKPCSILLDEPPPILIEVYQCIHVVFRLFCDKVMAFFIINKQNARYFP